MNNLQKPKENELSLNELLFVEAYFANNKDARAAYKAVYHTTTDDSLRVGVNRLLRKQKIKDAIINTSEQFLAKNKIDVYDIVENIKAIEKKAREEGKAADALRANELLAKLAGAFDITRKKESSTNKPVAIQINIQPPTTTPPAIDISYSDE